MKINQITYYDKELEWRFEPIHFSELTLLVGVSGVGKTQILESIMNLRRITRGSSLNGVKWDISFSIHSNNYRWQGEFETNSISPLLVDEDSESENDKNRIINEYLFINDKNIIERNKNEILFYNKKLPKLSPFKSAVEILSEEEDIAPVKNGFNRIVYSDQSRGTSGEEIYPLIYAQLSSKKFSLEHLQESNLPIQLKLALAYQQVPEIFNKIKESFVNIFVQVEDIKIEPDETDNSLHKLITEYPFIHIKEKGVDNWISQNHISSGMLRTLMHISELYLSTEGTVILIDEFENSLGVNCIDIVSDLLIENRKLQFIITSHHPYIINKIGMEHWKIVTRKGGVVIAKDIEEFHLPQSRHQAFMQLMNLDEYREGIAV
jgi:predicted ATPase